MGGMDLRFPDGIRAYYGFRVFRYIEAYGGMKTNSPLFALAKSSSWNTDGKTVATCLAPHGIHEAPDPNCECGLYAKHDIRTLRHYLRQGNIVAAVAGWGRVIRHSSEGWRSQFAKPVGFVMPDPGKSIGLEPSAPMEILRIAERLGAVVLDDIKELEAWVLEESGLASFWTREDKLKEEARERELRAKRAKENMDRAIERGRNRFPHWNTGG